MVKLFLLLLQKMRSRSDRLEDSLKDRPANAPVRRERRVNSLTKDAKRCSVLEWRGVLMRSGRRTGLR